MRFGCTYDVLIQGPEWGWPLGYFLRSYLYFDTRFGAGSNVCIHYYSYPW